MSKKVYNLDLDEMVGQKKLVVHATKKQLEEIKKLVSSLASGSINKKSDDIYELFPDSIEVDVPKLLINSTMGDLSGKVSRTEKVKDFDGSEEFYKKAESKRGFKLIADEFSDARNAKLYKGFNLIEEKWRVIVVSQLGVEAISEAPAPQSYRSKTYDHKVSQYVLSEFFENFLYQPASEDYVREIWKNSEKDEDAAVELTKLKKIDELRFPIGLEDLVMLQKARNTCMHFRVITSSEYSEIVEKMNEYLKVEALREFSNAIGTSLIESMKPFLEAQEALGRRLAEIVKPQVAAMEAIANALPDYSRMYQNMFGNLASMGIVPKEKKS